MSSGGRKRSASKAKAPKAGAKKKQFDESSVFKVSVKQDAKTKVNHLSVVDDQN